MADDIKTDGLAEYMNSLQGGEPVGEQAGAQEVPLTPEEAGLTPEMVSEMQSSLEAKDKYGDSPLTAAALSAADAASFSAAGRLFKKLGIVTQEDLEQYAKQNPEADIAGTILGVVAPALLTGGTSAVAQGGVKGAGMLGAKAAARAVSAPAAGAIKLGSAVENAVANAIAKSSSKVASKELFKKSLAFSTGQAAEGAAFGAGQLLREESLGNIELNADTIMAHMGTGALWGGVLGATMPSVGAALKFAGRETGQYFNKAVSKYADPLIAAVEYTGIPLRRLLKLKSTEEGMALLEDLPRFLKEEVKLTGTEAGAQTLSKMSAVQQAAGEGIESVVKRANELAAIEGAPVRRAATEFANLASYVDDNFLKQYKGQGTQFNSVTAPAKRIYNSLTKMAEEAGDRVITPSEIRQLRMNYDKLAKAVYEADKAGEGAKVAYAARKKLAGTLEDYIGSLNKELGEQLKTHNYNYHVTATVMPSLAKKIEKAASSNPFNDALLGSIVYGIGGPLGIAAAAGKKFLESDIRRKLTILHGIKNMGESITTKVGSTLDSFMTKTGKPSRVVAINAILRSPLAFKHDEETATVSTPKNRKEAFANITKNLQTFTAEPEKLLNTAVRTGAGISATAPQIAEHLGTRVVSAVQFLQAKLPKRPYEAELPGMKQKPYEPSSMELSKFERYVQAIDNPMSVLEDFESNAVTREHVEAIRAVYPALYQSIREAAFDRMQQHTDKLLSYQKRVQLSLLLNLDGDSSLLGKNISALQQNFMVNEQPEGGAEPVVKPTKGGAENINMSSREASDTQAFIKRRSEP